MFLKLGEIKGESTDSKHPEWIEILGWSHSFSQPTAAVRSSSGSTAEKANHSDLSFTKYLDNATDAILSTCWKGEQLKKATIECYRADGTDVGTKYLTIDMEFAIVSNYSISGGGGDIPLENISLSYGTVAYTYTDTGKATGDASGSHKPVKHDLTTNKVEG